MPLLSVVVPSYNHARYIGAALASIEAQTVADIEIVVVDDGSPDESMEVIGAFAAATTREIVVARQPNAGAHAAIERGLALARGEHLAILNSDDLYEPARFEMMLAAIPSDRPYLAFTGVKFIDENGEPLPAEHRGRSWYDRVMLRRTEWPGIGLPVLIGNFSTSTSNFLFSRSMHRLAGPFRPFRMAHDKDFLLRCLAHFEPVVLAENLLRYRVHPANTIRSNPDLLREENRAILDDYFNRARSHPPSNPLAPFSPELWERSVHFLRTEKLWYDPLRHCASLASLREDASPAAPPPAEEPVPA